MVTWAEVTEPIKLEDHSARHEAEGADKMSIKDLSGVPSVINNVVCYEDTVVIFEDNVVENEV